MKRRIFTLLLCVILVFTALSAVPCAAGADVSPVSISAQDVMVSPGEDVAEVIISVGDVPAEMGLTTFMIFFSVDGGAAITDITKIAPTGSFSTTSNGFIWADTDGVFEESFDIAKLTVTLPEDAKEGDVFNVTLIPSDDEDNYLTSVDEIGLGAVVLRSPTIVVHKPIAPITFEIADQTLVPGEPTTFDVFARGISEELGLAKAKLTITAPGANITDVKINFDGAAEVSKVVSDSAVLEWNGADGKGVFSSDVPIATVTLVLPEYFDGDTLTVDVCPVDDFESAGTINESTVVISAVECTFTFTVENDRFTPGDVNGDGKVNNRDVIMTMKAVLAQNAGTDFPAGFIFKAADMNGDNKINNRDVIAVMKAVIAAAQK